MFTTFRLNMLYTLAREVIFGHLLQFFTQNTPRHLDPCTQSPWKLPHREFTSTFTDPAGLLSLKATWALKNIFLIPNWNCFFGNVTYNPSYAHCSSAKLSNWYKVFSWQYFNIWRLIMVIKALLWNKYPECYLEDNLHIPWYPRFPFGCLAPVGGNEDFEFFMNC